MRVETKSLYFANNAHFGDVRKAEKEKPYIVHPVHVARVLRAYGFDSNVVAAGFLHDVVEDTEFLQEEIQYLFGKDISSLVAKASQPDKKMSWEERKLQAIEVIEKQDLRHKAVVCADKISNLDDLRILFGKKQQYDFSSFRRGYDKQKWYYEEIYKSLVCGGYENHAMFLYLRQLIDEVFHSNQSFCYSRLGYQKQELKKLRKILKTMQYYGELGEFSFPIFEISVQQKRRKLIEEISNVSEKLKIKEI